MIYIFIYTCSDFIVLYPLFTVDLTQALNNCRETTGVRGVQENMGTRREENRIQGERKGRVYLWVGRWGCSIRKKREIREVRT